MTSQGKVGELIPPQSSESTSEGLTAPTPIASGIMSVQLPKESAPPPAKAKPPRWKKRTFNVVLAGLVIATAAFIVCSIYELITIRAQLTAIDGDTWQSMQGELQGAPPELRARALLETVVVRERYHQASSLLLSRAWTLQLAFLVGTMLSLVGATFVLGRFRDTGAKLEAEGGGAKVAFASSSPGLVLAVLGLIVMLVSMLSERRIDVKDAPLYLLPTIIPSSEAAKNLPPPPPFPTASASEADHAVAEMRRLSAAEGTGDAGAGHREPK
ncbi:MAG TPA: hypothetical protein VGI39_38410 [Polyangiaceae bacterium]|jgi:hypothetical protein